MSERRVASGGRWNRLAVLLLLVAASLLLAWQGFFFFRDNFSTHYPFKVVSAAAWRGGTLPWWNPTDGGGQPLAGNPNALTFYPDNVLYLLLPAHVAFNVHFLLHLALGWVAMRALTRSPFGATLWLLSGAAVSAMAFYNLATAVALIPFALWAARRSALLFGGAFGLLILGTEPMTVVATAMAVAIVAFDWKRFALAVPVALAIASPQIVAYGEIAREVERAHGYSAQTVLNASLDPRRLLEILVGPFLHLDAPQLFPSLLLGVIVIPALVRRSRWTVAAAVMLFFALGRFNPLVRAVIEAVPQLRFARYPEKFALPLCAILVVLAAMYFEEAKAKRLWLAITFVPLLGWAVVTFPIDWWSPYALPSAAPVRVFVPQPSSGQAIDRETYRAFARQRVPLFGATAGLRYVLNRSGDGMHSLLSRIAAERFAATHHPRYLAIVLQPSAMIVPRTVGVRSINEAVHLIESGTTTTIAPRALASDPQARVTSYQEFPDRIEIGVEHGPAVLFVNQSYFSAWDAGGLPILPLDLDRLGVLVPAGSHTVVLRFGRHRTLTVAAWVLSSLLLLAVLLALRVEKRDGGAGEVERAADEDGAA
jgi:hypothetical protein